MRFIQFDPQTMTVSVTGAEQPGGANVPVCEVDIINDNPYNSRIPLLSTIYKEVLYAAKEAEDRKQGRNVEYLLAPPDPWLIALGLVMWEGIVQGVAWDAVKVLVSSALAKLRKEGVAPASDKHQVTRKESVELGFCWVQYSGGDKLKEMFVGLRKHHESQSKPPAKRKSPKRNK
jgi:hypothetical protein